MRTAWLILLLQGACNLLATAWGVGIAWLSLDRVLGPDARAIVLDAAIVLTAGAYCVGTPSILYSVLPVGRALDALRGGAVDAAQLEAGRRRALELPILLSRMSLLLWILPASVLLGAGPSAMPTLHPDILIRTAVATVLTGVVASTFVFYLVEQVCRTRIVPVLIPDGDVSAVKGVRPIGAKLKLVILIGNTSALPVLVLALAAISGVLGPRAILYAAVSFAAVGLLQGIAIARSIDEPVRALAKEVARVTAGDLQARAQVTSADEVGRLAEGFNAMVDGLRRGAFVRETFGRYLAPAVVDEIIQGNVALGGELRTATILFSDIRGFTSLSEQRSAPEVVRLLNRYLDAMVEVLVSHGATIDKFIGDAIVATFGVPVSRPDDASRAVSAAVAML